MVPAQSSTLELVAADIRNRNTTTIARPAITTTSEPGSSNHNTQTTISTTMSNTSPIAKRPPPLRIDITLYRLLNIVILLALGIAKSVYSATGQSSTADSLDWAGGLLATVVYVRPRYVELVPTLISLLISQKLVLSWLV